MKDKILKPKVVLSTKDKMLQVVAIREKVIKLRRELDINEMLNR